MARNGQDIIVIGGSAGGLDALMTLVGALPANFGAAVFVVVHTSPRSSGMLAPILDRASPLPAVMAVDQEPIERARIYVAPPDHHLVIKPGMVRTPRGPQENGFRPAVDPLFRTAALAYGPRVAGIILSGGLNDGTYGLGVIKEQGGVAIVQDPEEAVLSSMPLSALRNVEVDHILPVAKMAPLLMRLLPAETDDQAQSMKSNQAVKRDIAEGRADALETGERLGPASVYTCPECGGVLFELTDKADHDKLLRYRCHVGHGHTAETLLSAQDERGEAALWNGWRALEETAALRRRLAVRMRQAGMNALANDYEQQARHAQTQAHRLHELLGNQEHLELPPENGTNK
ncbi:MAG TPA: chemotaxis protein CheB [Pirellulales bacterium]|jgi:two-component system chemotaxis response regulator CheB|nr:chemotaxis protein CheB [Pirellulales bacterium]